MRRRLLTISCIVILLHIYIGLQLISDIHFPILQFIILVWLTASVPLIFAGIFARFITKNQFIVASLAWVGMLEMGLFSTVLVLTFFRQIILFILGLLFNLTIATSTWSAFLVLGMSFLITFIGLINARRTAKVTVVEIPIPNIPAKLVGFTIAQISDIHVGPTIKRRYLEAVVKRVNSLHPDMVAITGDLVDGSVEQLSYDVAPLAELKSLYGSFFVLGNHEYYSGADSWTKELRRLGITVLLNQYKVIIHHGAKVVIAGVTDFSGGHFGTAHISNPKLAIEGAPHDSVKILLAHQPRSVKAATGLGYQLQLSGHTHGGQFWPWSLFVRFQQPFTAGLKKMGDMWVYTNRGTGYWGPPKRFGVASEITLIKLVTQV